MRSDPVTERVSLICPLIFSKTRNALSICKSVSKGSDMANSYLSDETITRCESGSKEEKVRTCNDVMM